MEGNKDQNRNKWNKDQKDNRKINKNKSWFFEKINKINKTLARLRKKRADSSK